MGQADIETKEFMSDPARFADAFNHLLFDGEQVIKPDELHELDTTEIALPYGIDAKEPVQKARDVLKGWTFMYDDQAIYAILGVENQTKVHYAQPVQCGLYDMLNYAKQVQQARKSYRNAEDPTVEEQQRINESFLSGFHKDDKLLPVITLVIYFGAEDWDGPRSLHAMLASHDPRLDQFIADYKINLLSPSELSDEALEKFHTELGLVLKYLKFSKDKKKLDEAVHGDDAYKSLTRETFDLINTVTGSTLDPTETEGGVDMCKALEDMRKDAVVDVAMNLIAGGKLTLEEIAGACKLPLEKIQELAGVKTA